MISLLLLIVLLWNRSILSLLLKRVIRHLVEAENRLVGVLDKDVLALGHLQAHIRNGTDDTPAVGQVECHLGGELTRLSAEDAENDVVIVVLGVGTGHETATVSNLVFSFGWSILTQAS